MSHYKYLLFDLDGTLFDYELAEQEALKSTFLYYGYDYHRVFLDSYREINARLWAAYEKGKIDQENLKTERFRLLGEAVGKNFNPGQFSKDYLHNLSKGIDLIEDAHYISEILSTKFQLFLITNGLKDVQRPRIAGSSISSFFRDIIISEEVGYAKPDRRIFDHTFRLLKHPLKSEVLIIGDSLSSDMTGGANYGIDTCWYNPAGIENATELNITYEISSLTELLNILNTEP